MWKCTVERNEVNRYQSVTIESVRICAFSTWVGRLMEGWWNDENEKVSASWALQMWKSRVPYLQIHVSLHLKCNCFWHVPLWDIYSSQMDVNQCITAHCTAFNHNTYCIAIYWKIALSVRFYTEPLVWTEALISMKEDGLSLGSPPCHPRCFFVFF